MMPDGSTRTAPATVHDFGSGPVPVWYEFHAEYSAAPGRWPLRVSCCATGPIAAVRKMRRAFPPEPGTRLVRLDWSRMAPLTRPMGSTAYHLWRDWYAMEDSRPDDGPDGPEFAAWASRCAELYTAAKAAESQD